MVKVHELYNKGIDPLQYLLDEVEKLKNGTGEEEDSSSKSNNTNTKTNTDGSFDGET